MKDYIGYIGYANYTGQGGAVVNQWRTFVLIAGNINDYVVNNSNFVVNEGNNVTITSDRNGFSNGSEDFKTGSINRQPNIAYPLNIFSDDGTGLTVIFEGDAQADLENRVLVVGGVEYPLDMVQYDSGTNLTTATYESNSSILINGGQYSIEFREV